MHYMETRKVLFELKLNYLFRFKQLSYHPVIFDNHPLTHPTSVFPLTGNIGQIIALQCLKTLRILLIGNLHLYWRPETSFVKLRQTFIMLHTLKEIQSILYPSCPIFVIGDFNTTPEEPPYGLITTHSITDIQTENLNTSFRIKSWEDMTESLNTIEGELNVENLIKFTLQLPRLKSVYGEYGLNYELRDGVMTREPIFTSFSLWRGTIDYIFHSLDDKNVIHSSDLLSIPLSKDLGDGLPNDKYGSDHVCLMALIKIE